MNGKSERVVILGASERKERYAYKAFATLRKYGHEVVPVHPALRTIEGIEAQPDLESVTGEIDTVTLYVNPSISASLTSSLIALKPRRVIFNPGTESDSLREKLANAGIDSEEACTLVLLETGQF